MLENYQEAKRVVAQCARDLMATSSNSENNLAADLVQTSLVRLQDESFTLVVLGEFKRGKSTLINAMLGQKVLPSALVPVTAIPTVVRYKDTAGAAVLFQNGERLQIALTEVEQYVAEKYNPGNGKMVHEVEIFFPAESLQEGMVLVDTPGVGSAYQHNTTAAYGYLPYADSAIFLISVDAPLSQVELDYLKDIQGQVGKIFFVLNKIDMADPSELAEVVEFTKRVLGQAMGDTELYLLPISARLALEAREQKNEAKLSKSHLDVLEADLVSFNQRLKGALVLASAANRLLKVVAFGELAQNLWRQAMDDTIEGLTEKIARFDDALAELAAEREDSIYLLYKEVDRVVVKITADMEVYHRKALPLLLERLQEYARVSLAGQSAKQAAGTLHKFVINLVQTDLEAKKEQEWQSVQLDLSKVADRFFDRIEAIVDRLLRTAAQIFNLEVDDSARKDYVLGDRRVFFHFHEHPSFIPNLTDLPLFAVIPASLARGHVLKKAGEELAELLDRNCGRVRYNIAEKIKESVRRVAGDLRLRADALAGSLKLALDDARRERGHDEETRASALADRQREVLLLREVRETLDAVLDQWKGQLTPGKGRQPD